VCCTAISGESHACDYPVDTFRRILDVNTTGTFLAVRAAVREMHSAEITGSIVLVTILVTSMSGHVSVQCIKGGRPPTWAFSGG
jgi:NAD(P)-dependent dehydrogenase (short-subunit alcohol dehydrogenase family)